MFIVCHVPVKYPLILSDFNDASIFLADFRKILTFNLTKIRPVGVEAYHAHGRT
jgi:hypothetical protein